MNEITLNAQMVVEGDPLRLRVGEPAVEGGYVVEKILFYPDNNLFNKGREVSSGCYAIFFVDIPERRLIMANAVVSVEVVTEKKAETGAVPELAE